MDEKHLDDLLHDMKRDYEKLPEMVDTRSVMKRIFQAEKKAPRKRIFPVLAMIVGMALFMVMATPYINDFRQGEFTPPGNANDEGKQTDSGDNEYEKLYEEIEQYLLERKEAFKNDLGLNSVDNFQELQNAENILDNVYLSDEPSLLKEGIAFELSTPSMLVESLDNENSLLELLDKLQTIKDSLSIYLTNLRLEYSIDVYDQEKILEAQDDVAIYQGPTEIAAFLDTLNNQGYRVVVRDDGTQSIGLAIDYQWLYEQTKDIDLNEGYKAYIELLATKIDVNNPGANNAYNIPWTEFDTVLLEIERLYNNYPDLRDSLFYDYRMGLLDTASVYLNDYLAGGVDTGQMYITNNPILDEMAKVEFQSFVEEYKDSRYVSIVEHAIKTYEQIDWQGGQFFNNYKELAILFDEKFDGVEYEDIYNFVYNSYGFANDLITDYETSIDEDKLGNYEPVAFLQLYMGYFDFREIENYSTLYTEDSRLKQQMEDMTSEEINNMDETQIWLDIINNMSIVVEEKLHGNHVRFTFVSDYFGPVTIEGSIQMKKEDGIWKVFDKDLNKEGFYYLQRMNGNY